MSRRFLNSLVFSTCTDSSPAAWGRAHRRTRNHSGFVRGIQAALVRNDAEDARRHLHFVNEPVGQNPMGSARGRILEHGFEQLCSEALARGRGYGIAALVPLE